MPRSDEASTGGTPENQQYGLGKPVSVYRLLTQVLELQHAELLLLSARQPEQERFSELNDDVRSLLDQIWSMRP